MPFDDVRYEGDDEFIADSRRVVPQEPDRENTMLSESAAAFRRENLLSATIEWFKYRSDDEPVEGYNGLTDMPDDLLAYHDDFAESQSPGETQMLIEQLRQEVSDKNTLARGGGSAIAWQIAAAVADPINLIPLAWPAKLAKVATMGRGIYTGTRAARMAKAAAAVAVGETALAGVTEAGLQAVQRDRAMQETLLNVGGAALMGSIVGSASGFLSVSQKSAIAKGIEQDLGRDIPTVEAEIPERAAFVEKISDFETDHIDRVAPTFGSKTRNSFLTPLTRLDESMSETAVRTKDLMAQHSLLKQSNLRGEASAPPLENMIHGYKQGAFSAAKRESDKLYKELLERGGTANRAEFNQAVGRAMRNGDKAATPEIAKAARAWRTTVFDPVKQLLSANGLLDAEAGAKWAESYFPRVYDTPTLQKEWYDLLIGEFQRTGRNADEAEKLALEVTMAIQDTPSSRLYHDFSPPGAEGEVFDTRTLPIMDNVLAEGGFLIDDVEEVVTRYLNTYVPDVMLHQRFGSVAMDQTFQAVKDEYGELITKAANSKVVEKLRKQMNRDIEDLVILRDRLRGTDGIPAKGSVNAIVNKMSQPLNAATSMVYLGGQTEAALPDIGLAQIKQGFRPMVKSFVSNVLDPSFRALSREEHVGIGVGIDNYLNARSYALTYADESTAQGVTRWMTPVFGKASLMTYWNTAVKHIAGGAVQTRSLNLIDKLAKGAKVSDIDTAILARGGIDRAMAKRVANQTQKYGIKSKLGGRMANTAKWQDLKARQVYESMVRGEVNNSIVTPGVADTPNLTSTNFGKFLFKFQSFMLGAHNQILLPTAQRMRYGDMAKRVSIAGGISTSLAMGAMVEEMRRIRRNDEDEMTDADWVKAAMDRSGVLGMLPTAYAMTDRFAAQGRISDTLGMTPAWNAEKDWKFGDLSPVFSWLEDSAHAVQQLGRDVYREDEEVSMDNLKDFWRAMPFQNLFWLQWMMRGDDDEDIVVE